MKFFLILSLLFSLKNYGEDLNLEKIKTLAATLAPTVNPDLVYNKNFEVSQVARIFKDPNVFFSAQPSVITLKLKDVLAVNPIVFHQEIPLPPSALESILVHELHHISDYETLSFYQISKIGLSQVKHSPNYFRYERYTDFRTIAKGYGAGLIQYREWLFKVLKKEKAIENKKKTYFGPEEIQFLMSIAPLKLAKLEQLLTKDFRKTPLSLEELKILVNSLR